MDQTYPNQNEPLPRFRVNCGMLELPFTCTLVNRQQNLATATILNAGYVMVDPESRQAVFVVTGQEDLSAGSE